ncbi:hypothetical protein BGZ73_008552 [Actinomortierella ambigua]|nr:hypothetical protein BGZ73_008552 [Actinomortierella ambigua]
MHVVHTSVHVLTTWPPELIQQSASAIRAICNNYNCSIAYNSLDVSYEISAFNRDQLRGAKEDMIRQIRRMESTEGLIPIPFPDERHAATGEDLQENDSHETFSVYEMPLTDDEDTRSVVSEELEPTDITPNFSLSSSASSSSSTEGIVLELDHRIRRPFDFVFVDRSQKDDVREIIAEKHGCRVDPDPTGRTMTFFGLEMDAVRACVREMAKVQEYYLRPHFRAEEICLVQNAHPDDFRIAFVPLARHDHYSKLITFVPTRYPSVHRYPTHTLFKAVRARKSLMTQQWVVAPAAHPLPGIRGLIYPNQDSSGNKSSISNTLSPWSTTTTSDLQPPAKPNDISGKRGDIDNWPPLKGAGKGTATSTPMVKQQPRLMSSVVRPHGHRGDSRALREKEWPAPSLDSYEEADFPIVGTWSSQKHEGDKTGKSKTTSANQAAHTFGSSSELTPSRELKETTTSTATTTAITTTTSSAPPTTPPVVSIEELPLISFDDDDLDFSRSKTSHGNKGQTRIHQPSLLDDDLVAKPALMDMNTQAREQRRSLRVLPLQRGPSPQSASCSSSSDPANNLYNYNMWKTMNILKPALEELQGRRKEIRLVGRLGHVIYDNVPAAAAQQLWEYTSMESSVFDNLGVRPIFSPVVFTTQELFDQFHRSMDGKPLIRSYFEFHCRSRTNPNSDYMPTVIKVPSDKAVLDLVVTPWECFGAVKFDSLDMEHGMELRLEAREGLSKSKDSALGRPDVKPYNQFRKKISIGPESRSISCSAIDRYLEVDGIQFKIEYLYKQPGASGDQFILKVTKIEDVVLERPSPILCTGTTRGQGRTWFEIEIEHQGVAKSLEENLTLKHRMLAEWTVDDILGSQHAESAGVLRDFLRQFQDLAERCQHL